MKPIGAAPRRWYQRIGPGVITACVVIGPGSILTSSRVGATNGFQMGWVVILSVLIMMVYTSLGAKLGAVASESPCTLVSKLAGRWLAIFIGLSVFFSTAAFQFGNNLGILLAFKEFETNLEGIPFFKVDYVILLFNALSISFLFIFRDLYRVVERMMMVLVGTMLASFAINLCFAKPSIMELLKGFVPPVLALIRQTPGEQPAVDISVLGLVGTTFVISAALYQSYLVRQKGWGKSELKDGQRDVRFGALILASITIMIMSTAAAELRGQSLNSVADVAAGLKPAFGALGHLLFCMGLFAAAYSSFLGNSMTGGFILADGLGLGEKPTDLWPRLLTIAVLLTGMIVALLVFRVGLNPVPAIVFAQATTVLTAPVVAASIWWLTSSRDIMGEHRNGPVTNLLALIGFLLLLAIAWYVASHKVWPEISQFLTAPA
mgnify:CR=1 FL=1